MMKTHLQFAPLLAASVILLLAWSSASSAKPHPDSLVENQDLSHKKKCDGHGNQGDFTHYILAEAYPATMCQSDKTFTCSYPKNVTSWTIHGLWPAGGKKGGKGPTCCDRSARFDEDSIQSLLPRLVKEWTNLKSKRDFYCFWRHEWITHGTCCPNSLQPEYNYLNTTLTLFEENFNFGNILSSAEIHPSNSYTADEISAAFGQGVVSEIGCSKINNKATLTEIRICLNKSFKAIQCPGGDGRFKRSEKKQRDSNECGKHSKIFYAPANSH